MKQKLFSSIDELKSFISWAKTQKVQAVSIGEVRVEFSVLAFTESEFEIKDKPEDSRTWTEDGELNKSSLEDEDLLYWSSNSVKG